MIIQALAREVYSRQKLLVLDSTLSGLDTQTEAEVQTRLFGNQGLLKTLNCTVILATITGELITCLHISYNFPLTEEPRKLCSPG